MNIRIEQIAAELRLAPSSVSVALNGKPGVSEATRRRVLDYAQARGWRPNFSARSLSSARAHAVGILLRRAPQDLASEPFWMSFLAGMEQCLEPRGESLVLRVVAGSRDDEADGYRRWRAERRVDGVVLFDLEQDDRRPTLLNELGLPFVVQGTPADAGSPHVYIHDTQHDVDLLIEHALSLGHARVLHLTGPLNYIHEVSRRDAIAEGADRAGLHFRFETADYSLERAEAVVAECLQDGSGSCFIIASNDLMAVGATRAVDRLSKTDVAITSWDDSLLCALSSPSITALDRQHARQAERITELLLGLIEDRGDVGRMALPSVLSVRRTSVSGAAGATATGVVV